MVAGTDGVDARLVTVTCAVPMLKFCWMTVIDVARSGWPKWAEPVTCSVSPNGVPEVSVNDTFIVEEALPVFAALYCTVILQVAPVFRVAPAQVFAVIGKSVASVDV